MRVTLSILVSALACSAVPPRAPSPRSLTPPPPKPVVVWSRFAEVRGWPAVGEPFANSGHAGAGSRAVVRVSPDARTAYEHLVKDSELPNGALVALFHELADGRAGTVYVMEKSGVAWRYSAYRPDGVALDAATGCERCHLDAVADSLFGRPH